MIQFSLKSQSDLVKLDVFLIKLNTRTPRFNSLLNSKVELSVGILVILNTLLNYLTWIKKIRIACYLLIKLC